MRAFQSLRGIDWLTAATVVLECGDFSQFTHPRHVISFLGLVPMEASSGQSRHQGGLTKTGNAHVHRVLIQSAQHLEKTVKSTTKNPNGIFPQIILLI